MNVTHQASEAQVASLTVEVLKADYNEAVEKSLRDIRRNAVIKGFRPGHAPASLINKMYRTSALVEEVNKQVSNAISNYIYEQKLNVLGEPLPSEQQQLIDWNTQEDFSFVFDMAIAPEFEINLSKRDKINYYTIAIDEEMRNSYLDSVMGRHGSYKPAKKADEHSLLTATLTELDAEEAPKENGVSIENGRISIMLVANEDEKAKLIGAKSGDVLVIDVIKAFPNETDRAALLNIPKEELQKTSHLFQATITEVQQWVKAELNQELFDQLYGKDTVKTEVEFYSRIDEDIKANLRGESERLFYMHVRDKVVKKMAIELPKDFLVRWLVAINEGKFTTEQVEADYPHFEDDLKWQLIRDKIATQQEFKAEEAELKSVARSYFASQMMQYGMNQLPEEFLAKYADDLLAKPEERRKFIERVIENKTIEWLKETIKIEEKEVELERFKELASKQ